MDSMTWQVKVFLLVGILFILAANSISIYLATDIFQSDSYLEATKIVNSVSVVYAVCMGAVVIYSLINKNK